MTASDSEDDAQTGQDTSGQGRSVEADDTPGGTGEADTGEQTEAETGEDGADARGSERLWSVTPEAQHTALQELLDDTAPTVAHQSEVTVGETVIESAEMKQVGRADGLRGDQRRARRRVYGFVRAYFMQRKQKYREFQRTLDQARLGISYDRYLTRLVYLAVVVAVFGSLLGAGVAWALSGTGLGVPLVDVGAGTTAALVLAALVGGGACGVVTWVVGTYYPGYRVGRRKRRLNLVFPDAVVFMYALSESGMNYAEIVERLAAADDAYGEVAREFDVVRRDMELYGNDLYTSLRNVRSLTPSENIERFVDDLLSLLEAGGDMTRFLDDQSERYFQRASEDQEDLLNTLALLGEVFVVGFVAAPLLFVVILIVISLLGDPVLFQLSLFIYAVMPLAFVGFAVLLSGLLDPYVDRRMTLSADAPGHTPQATDADDEESAAFHRFYRRKQLKNRLRNPFGFIGTSPARTLLVTVPLVAVYLGLAVDQGLVPLTVDGWRGSPVSATNAGVIVPLLGLTTPIALLHERQNRRRRIVVDRFPNTLYVLASANTMGISLVDGLGVVSRTASGYYSRQLGILQNDIRWNRDPSNALLRFANRVDVPVVSRTIKLLAEGRRSTTDLSRVLRIAAEDTRNRFRLVRRRKQEMNSYVVVVLVGYLIFLGVIVVLDRSYLTVVADILASADEDAATEQLITDVPVDTYRLLFFHAAVVQALGTGLVSGVLTDNQVATGLKYTVVLLVLAALTFTFVS